MKSLGTSTLVRLGVFLMATIVTSAFVAAGVIPQRLVENANQDDEQTEDSQIDQQDDEQTPAELPDLAISRYGEFGERTDQNGFYRLAYSPNRKFMAARDRDQVIHVFDVEQQKKITEITWYKELSCYISHLKFSPDSRFLVTATESTRQDENTRCWDIETGEAVCEIESVASQVHFSRDGRTLIVLGATDVERFAFPSGEKISSVKWKNADENALAMSEDGRTIVYSQRITARPHYKITVRDLEKKSSVNPPAALSAPRYAAISSDNLWVAVNHQRENQVWLTDMRQPQKNFTLKAHKQPILSISFSPDNRFLVSTSRDSKVIVWDLLTRMEIGQFVGHTENVVSSAVSDIGFRVATGANGPSDCSIIEWDLYEMLFEKDRPEFASFEIAWKELGSNFPRQSLNATREIVEKERWLELLRQKLVAYNMEISQQKIDQWIEELGSRKYSVRQAATDKLLESRGPAELMLRQALESTTLAEVKNRITMILRQPARRPKIQKDELRRLHRGIFALELIGSSEAVAILELIASSNPSIDLARDAADSLRRIQNR